MARRRQCGSTYYIRYSCSALAGERTPSGTYYYLFDGLGSVVGNGTYHYDPYGQLISQPKVQRYEPMRGVMPVASMMLRRACTSLGTRDRNSPTLGRWTQQDRGGRSIRQVNSGNWYVYADNALVENKTREIPQ